MTASEQCSFCAIVRREDPDVRDVYRDEHVVAFFPTHPAALGHTMIVPRQHIQDIWSLDADTGGHLARATIGLAAAVRKAMQPEGLNVLQSNGAAASQTVQHLHVHLLPRWEGDAIGPIWPKATGFTKAQMDRARTAVRLACAELMEQ